MKCQSRETVRREGKGHSGRARPGGSSLSIRGFLKSLTDETEAICGAPRSLPFYLNEAHFLPVSPLSSTTRLDKWGASAAG